MCGKTSLRLLILGWSILLLPLVATSQPLPCVDSTLVNVDSFDVEIPPGGTSTLGTDVGSEWTVITGRSATGQSVFVVDPASFTFTTGGGTIDISSNAELFSLFAQMTALEAAARGYYVYGSPEPLRVTQASCVKRTGSGLGTEFSACGSGCCWRDYIVELVNGSPVLTLVGAGGDDCEVGLPVECESTCGEEWEGSGGISGVDPEWDGC